MLENLKVYIFAAEQQSLTRAAAELGMTIATVSRRVHELENNYSANCSIGQIGGSLSLLRGRLTMKKPLTSFMN